MVDAVCADGEGGVTHEPGDLFFATDSAGYAEDEQEWAEGHGACL